MKHCQACGSGDWLSPLPSLPSDEPQPSTDADRLRFWSMLFLGLALAALAVPAWKGFGNAWPWYVSYPVLLFVVVAYARGAARIPLVVCCGLGAVVWALALWRAWTPSS